MRGGKGNTQSIPRPHGATGGRIARATGRAIEGGVEQRAGPRLHDKQKNLGKLMLEGCYGLGYGCFPIFVTSE